MKLKLISQNETEHGTSRVFTNVQTNGDHIRSMPDKELAEWLERIRLGCAIDLCGRGCPFSEVCYSNAKAPKEMLDWLKEEVSE